MLAIISVSPSESQVLAAEASKQERDTECVYNEAGGVIKQGH